MSYFLVKIYSMEQANYNGGGFGGRGLAGGRLWAWR